MPKLILTLGGNKIREFELTKEQMIIGRRASCDIQVENLSVSGEHAKIINILDDSFLEDLKSTNGTFVNGALIKKQALQNGDVVTIGKHKLHYVNENQGVEGVEQASLMRSSAAMPTSPSPSPAMASAVREQTNKNTDYLDGDPTIDNRATGGGTNLTITNGAKAGQVLPITKPVTTLGRPGVQVAAITRKSDKCFLVHIETSGDTNMPTLNGSEIAPGHNLLSNNDEIVIAGIKMVLRTG